jgi:hypothetical protein
VLNGAASKEIEWHCKHYVGRGLMKRFDSGDAFAKEMGIPSAQLKKTFDAYNQAAKTKKDPFGKKVRRPRSRAPASRTALTAPARSSSPPASGRWTTRSTSRS